MSDARAVDSWWGGWLTDQWWFWLLFTAGVTLLAASPLILSWWLSHRSRRAWRVWKRMY